MKKILAICLVVVMVFSVASIATLAVDPGVVSPIQGAYASSTIVGNNVNLRQGPNTTYSSLGQMNEGDGIVLYNYQEDLFPNDNVSEWALVYVTSGNMKGKFGFVNIQYIGETSPFSLRN